MDSEGLNRCSKSFIHSHHQFWRITHSLPHSWYFINFSLDSSVDIITKVSLSSSLGSKDVFVISSKHHEAKYYQPMKCVCAIPMPDSILVIIVSADVTKLTIATTNFDMDFSIFSGYLWILYSYFLWTRWFCLNDWWNLMWYSSMDDIAIAGPLWGESNGHQWIPLTKGQ